MTTANHFNGVVTEVQKAPSNLKASKLIDSIAQQMQNSSDAVTKQLGDELQGIKPQLVQACQQQA